MSRRAPVIAILAAVVVLPAALALAVGNGSSATKARAALGVKKRSIGRFDAPVYTARAPGSKAIYVVEQAGQIRVVNKGHKRRAPFLDIRKRVLFGGEQGLLSIAFHPGFQRNRLAYIYFTNRAGNNEIDEITARPGSDLVAVPGSRRTVLVIPHPGESNHNGGQLQFGPGALLYAGTGDGGGGQDVPNNAQNPDRLLGKILRIDPRRSGGDPYTSPASNPFVGGPGADEVYAIGLRNPFRFSIDRLHTGGPYILIGDVGQDSFEEVDYRKLKRTRAANFGWNDFEGFQKTSFGDPPTPSGTVKPVLAYGTHSAGRCAVVGGVAVRDRSLKRLRGRLLYGDYCDGMIRAFKIHGGRAAGNGFTGVTVPGLSSISEGPGGAVYATSLYGPVYRLVHRKH